ncbi:MAG TPA: hypothetical protein VF576_02925 [Rubricoccaceae bacterium]|jgi:hypothetical protein
MDRFLIFYSRAARDPEPAYCYRFHGFTTEPSRGPAVITEDHRGRVHVLGLATRSMRFVEKPDGWEGGAMWEPEPAALSVGGRSGGPP